MRCLILGDVAGLDVAMVAAGSAIARDLCPLDRSRVEIEPWHLGAFDPAAGGEVGVGEVWDTVLAHAPCERQFLKLGALGNRAMTSADRTEPAGLSRGGERQGR